jgi:hypothetical protein
VQQRIGVSSLCILLITQSDLRVNGISIKLIHNHVLVTWQFGNKCYDWREPIQIMKTTAKPHPHKNITGKRIRLARLSRHPSLSQQALALQLNARGLALDQGMVSRIEARDRFVLDYEVRAIARCLKTSIAWLYGERGACR